MTTPKDSPAVPIALVTLSLVWVQHIFRVLPSTASFALSGAALAPALAGSFGVAVVAGLTALSRKPIAGGTGTVGVALTLAAILWYPFALASEASGLGSLELAVVVVGVPSLIVGLRQARQRQAASSSNEAS